jgi:hypothetical protein
MPLPKIYCDMDGVLCDFKSQAEKVVGVPINKWMNMSKIDKWKPIVDKKDFWSTLPWMSGGKQLWSYINKYNPDILSAHVEEVRDPTCIPGKLLWAKRNLGLPNNRINLVRRFQKKDYAQTGYRSPAVLIDDYEKNAIEFTRRGGIGIYHTSTSNTIKQLKKLGF